MLRVAGGNPRNDMSFFFVVEDSEKRGGRSRGEEFPFLSLHLDGVYAEPSELLPSDTLRTDGINDEPVPVYLTS